MKTFQQVHVILIDRKEGALSLSVPLSLSVHLPLCLCLTLSLSQHLCHH